LGEEGYSILLNHSTKVQDEVNSVVPDKVDMAGEIQSEEYRNDEECDEGDVKMTETDQGREGKSLPEVFLHLECSLKGFKENPVKHLEAEREVCGDE